MTQQKTLKVRFYRMISNFVFRFANSKKFRSDIYWAILTIAMFALAFISSASR